MNNEKLELWQKRANEAETAYSSELQQMDERDKLYKGTRKLSQLIENQKTFETYHVRNIVAELIESQVDNAIPMPKVTARRPGDEKLAKLIEDMLRGEIDRLPFEEHNDIQERTMRIQGGSAYLCEWDSTQRTHTTVGEIATPAIHPKQLIPQNGVTSSIEDMDYIFLRLPQTKGYIKRRYNVDVNDEGESNPEVRGLEKSSASEVVTQYIAYYRNDNGGIGIYSWVNDQELEDIEDYQARRLSRCTQCGQPKPLDSDTCQCGNKEFKEQCEKYIDISEPIYKTGQSEPFASPTITAQPFIDENGTLTETTCIEPIKLPAYKPNVYPVVLIKNVSQFGTFLGGSDIDMIRDQQNTVNRLEQKIIDKLLKAGSYISLPDTASISKDEEEMKVIRLGSPADLQMIQTYTLEGDIQQDLAYLAQVYEEARQIIGITDSFQGRPDRTATSGKAKEISAQQSAGRLASKKTMKDAGFARLFEVMFKFILAYADEPKAVLSKDAKGNVTYETFNKWDFLETDSAGEYWWNDQFIFSCETTTPLAANREAMWQETRMNFESGAFGNPTELSTLILFWTKMEELHYPGASDTKKWLEERQQEALREAQAQQQLLQAQTQQQLIQEQPLENQKSITAPQGVI